MGNLLKEEIEDSDNKQKCISSRMIPAKLMYFFGFATMGAYVPYYYVFLTSIGLTTSQAGIITGLRSVSACFAGPFWGMVVDHTRKTRLIYIILNVGTLALMFPLPWIANHVGSDVGVKSMTNLSYLSLNLTNTSSSRLFTTVVSPLNSQTSPGGTGKELFVAMLMTSLISAMFDIPLLAYQDSITMNLIKTGDEKVTYGPQRIFGSIGFGIFNFIAGVAADNYDHPELSSYTAIFFVMLACGIFSFAPTLMAISRGKWEKSREHKKIKKESSMFRTILTTCSKPANTMFLLTIFVMGLANAFFYGFTNLLMEKEMDASKTVMGLVVVFSCASELMMFPIATKVIRFVGGNIPSILIGVFSYFFRFFILSYIENPLIVLPLQLLHCFGFALFWAAAVAQTEAISPENIKTTMFTILHAIHFSVGMLVGNVGGGFIYQKYGGRNFFRYSSLLFLTWSFVMVIYFYGRRLFLLGKKTEQKNFDVQLEDVSSSLVDKTDLS